jgi:hypothetical protein
MKVHLTSVSHVSEGVAMGEVQPKHLHHMFFSFHEMQSWQDGEFELSLFRWQTSRDKNSTDDLLVHGCDEA